MTTYYKLTDAFDATRGETPSERTQWGPWVTHIATGDPTQGLCSDAYIHAYQHPLLAVLHDPIGAGYGPTAHLWEFASDEEPLRDEQMKLGVRRGTTIRQIPLPALSVEQRVQYAILCAQAVLPVGTLPVWDAWADRWLDGRRGRLWWMDRFPNAAFFAAKVSGPSAHAAFFAAEAAARAAYDAESAAEYAAHAAHAAHATHATINLIALAQQAIREEVPAT